MKLPLILFLVTIAYPRAIKADDAPTAFFSLPPPKPALFSHVRTWETWRNPSLRIQDAGIFVNESLAPTQPEKLLEALAKLPAEAWPYGRIVAISAFGLSAKSLEAQKTIVERVIVILKSADIETNLWPSA